MLCDDISQQFWSVERKRAASQYLQFSMQMLQNKIKLEKESSEIRQINIILIEKILERDEYNDTQ